MSNTSTPVRTGSAFDLGVAALAAGSVAFLAFAMPEDLFSALIAASHLPDVLAAAAPPLGMKARYAAMAAVALATFLPVWALMRALDRAPAAARPVKKVPEADAPRVRRADAHPDAPARRPLLAGADLGEPELDVYELDHAAEPDMAEADAPVAWQPVAAPEPVEDSEPVAPTPVDEPASRLPRFLDAEVAPEPVRDPVVPASQKKPFDGLAARLPQAPEPRGEHGGEESINHLMQRLERGLADREEPKAAEPELPPALHAASENPDAALSSEGVRHRLRSAISDLNQLANRG
jgi:hypothetical protein